MAKSENKKFAWLIKNFSSLKSDNCYSDPVVIGDTKWRLRIEPKGETKVEDHLALYLQVADYQSLPSGWRRYAKFRFTIVNQLSQKLSVQIDSEKQRWFDQKASTWGVREILPLTKLHAKDGGFLVNDELLIVAEVDLLEVVDTYDESKEASESLEKINLNDNGAESKDLLKKTPSVKESVDVNGFQVLPSQVETVKRIFETHPDIASGVRTKSPHLRTTYINVVLGLIETLCQSPQDLSDDDLKEASVTLSYAVNIGFKLDWLEKKLTELYEKKTNLRTGEASLAEMEEELESLKKRRLELEGLLEKSKAEVDVAKIPLSFDDIVFWFSCFLACVLGFLVSVLDS